jgi:hypothetical protein
MKRVGIFSEGYVQTGPPGFEDGRWANIRSAVPELSAEDDAKLRDAVAIACGRYLTRRAAVALAQANHAALSGGAKERSEFKRFADALRAAANAWASLCGGTAVEPTTKPDVLKTLERFFGSTERSQSFLDFASEADLSVTALSTEGGTPRFHNDLLSDIRRFDDLESLAADAERRLAGLIALGEPQSIHAPESPWRRFVRALHTACKEVDLKPTLTKRQYGDKGGTPWFQEFVLAVRDNLLGDNGYPKHSIQAFHSETYEAIHGGEVKAG